MRKQILEMDILISRLKHESEENNKKISSQQAELDKLKGITVDSFSLSECDDLERKLKLSLDAISARKVSKYHSP